MTLRRTLTAVLVGLLLGLVGRSRPARAQRSGTTPRQLQEVGLEEQTGEKIPQSVPFKNARGETVRLGQYLGRDKPVLLTLVYHDCPMLCPMMLGNLTKTLEEMEWTPGGKFDVVSLSFNYRETPALARQKKQQYLRQLGRPEAASGWHFLTGTKENIQKITEAVGFNFKWIPEEKEYAHPATLIFINSDGVITRYLNGKALSVPPGDVRKALVETSDGKIGNAIDQVLLYCFQYDPDANAYVKDAFNIMRAGGVLTILLLGGALFFFWRRESRNLDRVTVASNWEEA